MTKDEMLKERDRLAENYTRDHFQADARSHIYKIGFNAALELSERERVKPLRDVLSCYGIAMDEVEEWE